MNVVTVFRTKRVKADIRLFVKEYLDHTIVIVTITVLKKNSKSQCQTSDVVKV